MFSWFTHVLIIDRPCLKLSWSPLRSLWHRSDPLLPNHSDSDLEASGRRLRRRSDTIYQSCWMRDWHHRHEKRIVWIGEHTLLLKFRVHLSQAPPFITMAISDVAWYILHIWNSWMTDYRVSLLWQETKWCIFINEQVECHTRYEGNLGEGCS